MCLYWLNVNLVTIHFDGNHDVFVALTGCYWKLTCLIGIHRPFCVIVHSHICILLLDARDGCGICLGVRHSSRDIGYLYFSGPYILCLCWCMWSFCVSLDSEKCRFTAVIFRPRNMANSHYSPLWVVLSLQGILMMHDDISQWFLLMVGLPCFPLSFLHCTFAAICDNCALNILAFFLQTAFLVMDILGIILWCGVMKTVAAR